MVDGLRDKNGDQAMKWTGWKLPLAMRMLPLIDYEGQREKAKLTNAIVDLDYYKFTVVLRRGIVTSGDMFWLLKTKLGLSVHTLAHPSSVGAGMNDKQWIIVIKAPACPRQLRSTGVVVIGGVELLIHHHSVFGHWPCTKCGNPEHPEKYCRVSETERELTKAQFTWKVSGSIPSETRTASERVTLDRTPKSFEELKSMLHGNSRTSGRPRSPAKTRFVPCITTDVPERSPGTADNERTKLPAEWDQQRPPAGRPAISINGQTKTPMSTGELNQSDDEECEEMEVDDDWDPPDMECTDGASPTTTFTRASARYGELSSTRGRSPTTKVIRDQLNKTWAGPHHRRGDINKARREDRASVSPTKSTGKNAARDELKSTRGAELLRASSSPERKQAKSRQRVAAARAADQPGVTDGNKLPIQGPPNAIELGQVPTSFISAGGKGAQQRFMHQYLQSEATMMTEADTDAHQNDDEEETKQQENEDTGSSQDCEFVGASPPSDPGIQLSEVLKLLGGVITDVAANGQCGWLAFHAALNNRSTGLKPISEETAKATNELKKVVMNGIIANLRDEVELHPEELRAELLASANEDAMLLPKEAQVQVLATHYMEQRRRSVRADATPELWVRAAHIKGMAMHAREEIYVLDVESNGQAHVQVYAYRNEKTPAGEAVETGTVTALDTALALARLEALVGMGWCPVVMLLQWKGTGNHFQAVTYPDDRFSRCREAKTASYDALNAVLGEHGGQALDRVPYDRLKNAHAAKKELSAITKAAKKGVADATTTATTDNGGPQAAEMEMKALQGDKITAFTGGETETLGDMEASGTRSNAEVAVGEESLLPVGGPGSITGTNKDRQVKVSRQFKLKVAAAATTGSRGAAECADQDEMNDDDQDGKTEDQQSIGPSHDAATTL